MLPAVGRKSGRADRAMLRSRRARLRSPAISDFSRSSKPMHLNRRLTILLASASAAASRSSSGKGCRVPRSISSAKGIMWQMARARRLSSRRFHYSSHTAGSRTSSGGSSHRSSKLLRAVTEIQPFKALRSGRGGRGRCCLLQLQCERRRHAWGSMGKRSAWGLFQEFFEGCRDGFNAPAFDSEPSVHTDRSDCSKLARDS